MTSILRFKVVSIGIGVRSALEASDLEGEVVAVYTNSCYAKFDDGQLVCIGNLSLDDGPLTVRVAFPLDRGLDTLGIRTGSSVHRASHGLKMDDSIWLDISDAGIWSPRKIESYASTDTIEHRANSVTARLGDIAPCAGLASLIKCAESLSRGEPAVINGQIAQLAHPRIKQLIGGIWSGNQSEIDAGISGLVGLGPGLTPSGDDLLGGMMIGLRAMEHTSPDLQIPLSYMERSINRIANSQTTAVSSALLDHATRGIGSASVHRLVQSLLQLDDSLRPLEESLRVSNSGHTSGWDCLAGLLIGVHFGLRMRAANRISPFS